ncbi:hypothetical protein L596_006038 [Steinernema carpocapsae]|uniref:Nuclear receptor domain-containing protein n=1 Tax=Steinernema carpocapsae TaxID=34508 RepID=A0A4U8V7S5_STECR|nr:hypothetical protein L596_006038 [Steinernema carpocapsae]
MVGNTTETTLARFHSSARSVGRITALPFSSSSRSVAAAEKEKTEKGSGLRNCNRCHPQWMPLRKVPQNAPYAETRRPVAITRSSLASDVKRFLEGCLLNFRAIIKKRQYVCTNNNQCNNITKDSRKACRACRLQKCIDIGMRKEALHPRRDLISIKLYDQEKTQIRTPSPPKKTE